jgi:hypothetical protein
MVHPGDRVITPVPSSRTVTAKDDAAVLHRAAQLCRERLREETDAEERQALLRCMIDFHERAEQLATS